MAHGGGRGSWWSGAWVLGAGVGSCGRLRQDSESLVAGSPVGRVSFSFIEMR